MPYDTFKDFVGVSLLVRFALVLGAHPTVPGATLRQFLDRARTEPANRYNYASTGVGSLNHLIPENLQRLAGVDLLHVPYGGGGPAVQAVLGNTSQMTFLSHAALRGQIQAARIKPLAVTGSRRLPELPDVPTVAESGFPGFEAYSWIGIFVPAATPGATVQKLGADFQAVLADGEVRSKLGAGSFEVVGSTGEQLDRHLRTEHDRWAKFVKDSGLKLDD
ncbi:MAG: tripartite tricarboxylate transporter substrate binding protein [Burkholderiaceae bacterium]|nr:tripartite tricarboxylate transporter substrate binding protein [Burkholderiaceae bacterium]